MHKITILHSRAGVNWGENSATFSVDLARYLDNYFEVELLSGAPCGSFSRPIKSLPRSKVGSLTRFFPCLAYLLKHPPDLLLPQDGYSSLLIASCIRAIKGTPILFTEHHGLLNQGKYLKRNLGLQPDRLIALNPMVADYAIRQAPNQLITTIPYGINPTEFCPEGKAIVNNLSQPCIVAVSSLNRDRHQRLELTIQAVSRLKKASLLICGDGTEKNYFQQLGDRLLGAKRFKIKTFAYAQMPQVYRSANVFTCAATQEHSGLKYIEAMACGLPVVATDDAVRRYLIGHGGITCDVTNLDCYAKSLEEMLEKHWYLQQPRQNALRFSWHGIALLYYRAILKTIAESNNNFAALNAHHSVK